ncbi:MAG: LamG-like jellyroll fold domain-containing protein [Nanoarchaeota archaeon]|nr:LamG-like jellyroll fold domain-containing protein [Nanoarchaeota archaeon]
MRRIVKSLLFLLLLFSLFLVSCAAQMTDEELEAELAKLTPEEREALLKDLENEKGAFAGQAIAKYSSKLAGVPKERIQAASKGCTDSVECPLNYVCENSKCIPLREEPQVPLQLSAGPQVFNTKFYQSPVRADPDDLLLIPGYGFEPGAVVAYRAVSDKPNNLQPPAIVPNTNTPAVGKLYIGGITTDSISVLLPKEMTTKQAYALWVKNPNSDWSEAILINDPRPLWVTPSLAYATQKFAALPREIKVIGRNLENKVPAAAPAQLRLVGSETYTLFVIEDNNPDTAIEHYAAKAVLPASMQPGVYSVQYSRGGADWIDLPADVTFTVLSDPQPKQSFDISSYGCSADDGLDDTSCIVQAIAAANTAGGGEVFFPTGTWEIGDVSSISTTYIYYYNGIVVPQGVDLVGAGIDKTNVKQTLGWKEPKFNINNVFSVFTLNGHNKIRDIHFQSEGYNQPIQTSYTFFALGKVPHTVLPSDPKEIEDVMMYNNRFSDMYYAVITWGFPLKNIFVVNNKFQPTVASLGFGGSGNIKTIHYEVRDSVVINNTFFPGDVSINSGNLVSGITGAQRMDFSGNVADGTVNGGWRAAFFFHSLSNNERLLISNNKATCTGDKTGDGEAIVFDQNENVAGFSSYSMQNVAAATANTVSVNGDWLENTPGFYNKHFIFITDGKGLGQARKIVSYTNTTNPQITVSPDWDVIPDSGSTVSVGRSVWNAYMVDNLIDIRGCLKNNPVIQSGLLGWAATTADSTIEGNHLYDTNGILVLTGAFTPSAPHAITYASEIRNNLIDGEYKSPHSMGGISLWYGAHMPNPVMGHNLLVSHNTVKESDTRDHRPESINILLRRAGIGIVPTGAHFQQSPYQWKSVLLFHNAIENVPAGIYIVENHTRDTVMYQNNFAGTEPGKEIIDEGANSVYCGNKKVELNEVCDDGLLEECPYGQISCQACSAQCTGLVSGKATYCGDNFCDIRHESTSSCPGDCGNACATGSMLRWWPGDASGYGYMNDKFGNNDGGVLKGGAVSVPGMVGEALSLDGVDDYVEAKQGREFTALTFTAWVKPTLVSTSVIIGSDLGHIWFLQPGGSGGFYIGGTTDGVNAFGVIPYNLNANTWAHIAVTWDKDNGFKGYTNGVEIASAPSTIQTVPWGVQSGFVLGVARTVSPMQFFQGGLDEVQIWERVLTASEVQAIYNAGSKGMCQS